MNIDEKIKHEYENMRNSIMPSERIRHAKRLAQLQKERDLLKDTGSGWNHRGVNNVSNN